MKMFLLELRQNQMVEVVHALLSKKKEEAVVYRTCEWSVTPNKKQ